MLTRRQVATCWLGHLDNCCSKGFILMRQITNRSSSIWPQMLLISCQVVCFIKNIGWLYQVTIWISLKLLGIQRRNMDKKRSKDWKDLKPNQLSKEYSNDQSMLANERSLNWIEQVNRSNQTLWWHMNNQRQLKGQCQS